MQRVYLDHNVFTHLRQKKETLEPYKTLYSVIKRNNNRLFFVYSPSHLQDLKRSTNNEYTEADLEFINEITNGCYIAENNKTNLVEAKISDPRVYFKQLKEDTTLEDFDIDNLFGDSENSEITKLWTTLIDLWKATPSGINDDFFKSLDGKYGDLRKVFENTEKDNNLYSLFKDAFAVLSKPDEHSKTYTALRNKSIDDMKLNPNNEEWGNAFDYLDKVLAKSNAGNSFREMVENNLKISKKDKPITTFDYFINYYISLDSFGYFRDKHLPNLIDDAMHAYYGAYCDYFVTDDNRTYQKAKAVYENFNIGTRVCKTDEFPSEFYKLNEIASVFDQKSVTDRVVEVLKTSLIMLESADDELNPATIYKVDPPIADYFTRLQVTNFEESTVLLFYKKRVNYSSFLFWDEMKSITDKIVKEYGIDDGMKLEFSREIDSKEILENKWAGRNWRRNNLLISIFFNTSLNDLTFRMELFK